MPALIILHGAIGIVAVAAGRRLGRNAFWLVALAPAATLVWLARHAGSVIDGGTVTSVVSWVPALGIDLRFRLDGFALLMVGLISGVGLLVCVYSTRYFSDRPHLPRFAAILSAFAGSMLGVVLTDNLIALYLFWELTSVTSYLLIGFEDEKGSARSAALQAILVTGAGGLAMLAGFVLLGQAAGTYQLSAIVADPPAGAAVAVAAVLVLLGAFTKSAQVPFHNWLPGAMAAPTPVSAYLHSATMVKAGIYLIARLAPALSASVTLWRPLVVVVGVTTMVVGGLRALRQHDLKLLLAHGTVSQLGFMVVLVGYGSPALTFAGAALILAHGLFKATLFLVVGIVDHQAHSRDLRVLTGLGRRMPATFVTAALAAASMAGIAPLLGFVAKEAAVEGLLHAGGDAVGLVALVGVAAGSVLTMAYGARFLWGGFALVDPASPRQAVGPEVPPPSWSFLAPAALLAVLSAGGGLVLGPVDRLVGAAGAALDPAAASEHLALWHGFTLALGVSALSIAVGGALFVYRSRVERVQERLSPASRTAVGVRAYAATLSGLNLVADRVTGILQSGSLPVYVGTILLATVLLPAVHLLTRTVDWPADVQLAASPQQVAAGALVLGAALATVVARRRFVAVLSLGAVGFGVATLFVIQGAPDLALTQLLVETVSLVLFVLVLRHLPPRFETAPWRLGQGARWVLAVGVGALMATFAVAASTARSVAPISRDQVARALPEAGGRNVVNVILTDFRGLDTLGEITVLVVAALGIASLVTAGRRGPAEGAEAPEGEDG